MFQKASQVLDNKLRDVTAQLVNEKGSVKDLIFRMTEISETVRTKSEVEDIHDVQKT